jgi:hypothetical protein
MAFILGCKLFSDHMSIRHASACDKSRNKIGLYLGLDDDAVLVALIGTIGTIIIAL